MPKIATQGDKIVGTDTHIVMVPSPSGPVPTPLPHLFQGTIVKGCDQSVTINGKPIAVEGAEAINDTPHVPTPPGTSFQRQPKNKSVVKKVIKSIEINGKYAVLEGSPAMNCNDPEDAPTGIVRVLGPSIEWEPFADWKPIPEFRYDEYVRRKQQNKEEANLRQSRSYQVQMDVKMKESDVQKEGEIISLRVIDDPIYYGNPVIVQVKASGVFYRLLTLRRIILDSAGKCVIINERIKFYIGGENIKYLSLPALRFNKEDFQKIFPNSRLFLYFEVVKDGEVIYQLPDSEIKEIFTRVGIKFHQKNLLNEKSTRNIRFLHSNSVQMNYTTNTFSKKYIRMKKVAGGKLQLLTRQKETTYDVFKQPKEGNNEL